MANIDPEENDTAAEGAFVLAWDIGGTLVKLGWVRGGRLLVRGELEVRRGELFVDLLERMVGFSGELGARAGVVGGAGVRVGMAFPGIIEPVTGRILSTPEGKFDDAVELDVAGWVKRRTGWDLVVDGDANAALAGEWRHGAAVGVDNVVMMTLGTGIGTAVMMGGRPLRGAHGQAG
ncbi:MAG: hypothetical protein RI897_4419, partial [Verrucomicrobiota bacterium]